MLKFFLIKVAILGSGINPHPSLHLCKSGHISFVDSYPLIEITKVKTTTASANVISNWRRCVISVKITNGKSLDRNNINQGLLYVKNINVDKVVLNYYKSEYDGRTAKLIKDLLDKGVKVYAGISGQQQPYPIYYCNLYPACYDKRIIVTSSLHYDSDFRSIIDRIAPPLPQYVNPAAFGIR